MTTLHLPAVAPTAEEDMPKTETEFDGLAASEVWRQMHPEGLSPLAFVPPSPKQKKERSVEEARDAEAVAVYLPRLAKPDDGDLTPTEANIYNIEQTLAFLNGHSTCAGGKAMQYIRAYRFAFTACNLLKDVARAGDTTRAGELLDELDDLVSKIDDLSQPARRRGGTFKAAFVRIDEALDALDEQIGASNKPLFDPGFGALR